MRVKKIKKIYDDNNIWRTIDLKHPSLYIFYMDNENIYSLTSVNHLEGFIYQLRNGMIKEGDNDLIEKWKHDWSFEPDDYEEENNIYWDFESEDDKKEMIEVLEYIMSLNIEK